MKVDSKAFKGQHCETTTTGTLLKQIGIDLSEPMLFGLGEGLSYLIWHMKIMDFPFIGGRIKPDLLTHNLARNLNLKLNIKETTSQSKAWDGVKGLLDDGTVVGLKLDCYHLEYFTNKIHFAGHYAAINGYDDEYAYLVDTAQQGSEVKTSLKSLSKARNEKGPMSSRNLFYTLTGEPDGYDLKEAVVRAARLNAEEYLNPPISNVTYRGIEKTAKVLVKWFESSNNIEEEFSTSAMLIERAGTGGSLFRNFYRDFLKEAYELTEKPEFKQAHSDFAEIAVDWSKVVELFELIAKTQDKKYVDEAAMVFMKLSVSEREAMERLRKI